MQAVAGQLLGLTLADYLVHRAELSPSVNSTYDAWKFDGGQFPGMHDFQWRDAFVPGSDQRTTTAYFNKTNAQPLEAAGSPPLHALWKAARREWR